MKNLICFLFVVFTSSILFGNTTPEPQSVSVIAFSGLKIRATPGVDGKVLDVVAFGEKVEILEDSEITQTIEWLKGKWIKVAYHNVEGYVFDGFVTKFPIPTYDFELTQNDLDIAYPLLAWAENNFDEINSMDTIERANSIKVIQYLEGGIQISREDTDYKFESVVTLPNTKISDGYNLVKSMLLTKNERKVFEDKSVFISNRGNGIDKIKIDVDAPIEIKDIGDGSIKISVVSFHEGCGL
ncbi:MAG: SH3 domain-containing protein [Saprospiraceae bacterium]|nr:SH3 domain-containing protein [Bacteroidia bacterium]NNL92316.1 SH3 domain-containing protein [Saprospiraceae bacterium]